MATSTIPHTAPLVDEFTDAENQLFEVFEDLLETLPAEKRSAILQDLRANAEAHGG
jgi:hypothetical protein